MQQAMHIEIRYKGKKMKKEYKLKRINGKKTYKFYAGTLKGAKAKASGSMGGKWKLCMRKRK